MVARCPTTNPSKSARGVGISSNFSALAALVLFRFAILTHHSIRVGTGTSPAVWRRAAPERRGGLIGELELLALQSAAFRPVAPAPQIPGGLDAIAVVELLEVLPPTM